MANGYFTFLQAREGPKLDRSCREPDDKIIRYHRYDLLRFTCIANVFSTPAHARGTVSKAIEPYIVVGHARGLHWVYTHNFAIPSKRITFIIGAPGGI
jgi:hypothetical protein